MKRRSLFRVVYLILTIFLIGSSLAAQPGKDKPNGNGGGGKDQQEDTPLEILVYDLEPDGVTPYSIQSDGAGLYFDQLDGTDAVILGTSGNLIFRPAGTKDFDLAIRRLTFTFGSDLPPVALEAGLDDPQNHEPGAIVGKGDGVADMLLDEVRASRTNVRLATIDGYRYRLEYLGDETNPEMSAFYRCTAADSSGCTQWQVSGYKALLVRFKLKGKDSRIPENLGIVTMPFELLATVH